MKKFIIIIIGISFFNIAFSQNYIPVGINSPLFNNKKEFIVGISGGKYGIGPNIAFSFTDNFGVSATVFVGKGEYKMQDYRFLHDEILAGSYFKLSDKYKVELLAGFGSGKIYFGEDSLNLFFKAIFQPSIGFSSNNFDFAFSLKTVFVYMKTEFLTDKNIVFEPSLTARYGIGKVFFYINILNSPLNSFNISTNNSSFILSGGFVLKFGKEEN
jgi:hypothetical protein